MQLIDAAGRVLAEEGPQAMSTRRIAQEVGTSTSAIYSLLGSKIEMVRAMYLEGFTRLADRQSHVAITDDPLVDLQQLALAYFENALANPHLYDVMFHRPVPEFVPEPDDVAFALTTLQDVVDVAQRIIDAGLWRGNARAMATEVWALVHGVTSLTLACMLTPDDARKRLQHLMRAVVAGYLAEAR
jgi:AcrR family transcriptional regulator